jgi:hypothetical protein
MTSNIDATKPVHGSPTTESVRNNFGIAKSEITDLQDRLGDGTFIPLAGGVKMTGLFELSGDPALPLNPATKQYVDSLPNAYVPLAGGTMTGPLVLFGDPIDTRHAATKSYVDVTDALLAMQISVLAQDLFFVGGIDVVADFGNYTAVTEFPDGPLPPPGESYKGFFLIVTIGGMSKPGNIPSDVYKAGDWLVCNGAQWFHLGLGQVNAIASNVGIAPPIGNLGATVQTGLAWLDSNKVNKYGDTLTGFITLHADPMNAGHATTKSYVDARSGVTTFNGRTGNISLRLDDVIGIGGAPISSPIFQGNPSALTPLPGNNSSSLATTAFVQTAIAAIPPPVTGGGGEPAGVSSFNTRTGVVSLTLTDVTGVGGAPLSSPIFTGSPTAPTPSDADVATRIVTKDYLNTVASRHLPLVGGTLSGFLNLHTNPIANEQATNKAYVDFADELLRQGISVLAQDLYFVGGINVVTDQGNYTAVTEFPDDSPLPAPSVDYKGFFLIVTVGGASKPGNIPPDIYAQGDWLVCNGDQWFHLGIGQANAIASNIGIVPAIGSLGANVQTGLAWLDGNKVNKHGDTLTGFLTLHAEPQAGNHPATKGYVDARSGVNSFNNRTGAITLTLADVTNVGGAPLNSPGFVGSPTAPTPAAGDNDTSIATTAFVNHAVATNGIYLPLAGGTIGGNLTVNGAFRSGDMFIKDSSFGLNRDGTYNHLHFESSCELMFDRNGEFRQLYWMVDGVSKLYIDENGSVVTTNGLLEGSWVRGTASVVVGGIDFQLYNSGPNISILKMRPANGIAFDDSTKDWVFQSNELGNFVTVNGRNGLVAAWRGQVAGAGQYINILGLAEQTNVMPSVHGLETILKINPIRYMINARMEVGFSAQELLTALPESVREIVPPDKQNLIGENIPVNQSIPEPLPREPQEPITGMSLDPIVAALVNAVKEMNMRIVSLETQLAQRN